MNQPTGADGGYGQSSRFATAKRLLSPANHNSVTSWSFTTFPWIWGGRATRVQSRCIDETGYLQPTHAQRVAKHGLNYMYHHNGIQCWDIGSDGEVDLATGI